MLKPKILQLESTNDCMLNCRICMRVKSSRPIGYLSMDKFVKLPLTSFKEVAFHGWGEPLLHPDLFKMVSHASRLGIRTSLITNGYLIRRRLNEILSSPLNELAVGIYTLKGREEVLKGVKELIKSRRRGEPRVLFDVTILKENLSEIPEIVVKASELGIDGVVLHRLFNLHDPSLKRPSRDEEVEMLEKVRRVARESGIKVYPPPNRRVRPCIVALNCLFITWDCMYSPCCFLAELGYLLGNALRDDIFIKHLKFMAGMRRNEYCRKCPW